MVVRRDAAAAVVYVAETPAAEVVVEDGEDDWLLLDGLLPDTSRLKSGVFMCNWARLFADVVVDVGTLDATVAVVDENCCLLKSGMLA